MKRREDFLFYNVLTEKEKESLKCKFFYKGDVITPFRGEKKFYYVLDGEFKFQKNYEDQSIRVPVMLTNDSIVGIISFLIGSCQDELVFVATRKCQVIEISYEIIKRLKKESVEFNSYLIKLLLNRSINEWEILYIRSFSGIKGVIAHYLVKNSINNYVYIENFTETLNDLNVSNNGFYRIIKKWCIDKVIEKNKNSIKILNREKLNGYLKAFII